MTSHGEYLRQLSRINAVDYQDPGTQEHLAAVGAALDDLGARAYAVMLARLVRFAPEDALVRLGRERRLTRYPGEYLEAFRGRVLDAWAFWRLAGTLPGMYRALYTLGYAQEPADLILGDTQVLMDRPVPEGPYSALYLPVDLDAARDSQAQVTLGGEVFTFDTVIIDDPAYWSGIPPRIQEHFQDPDPEHWAEFSVYVSPNSGAFTADPWAAGDGSTWGDDGTLWGLGLAPGEPARIRAVLNDVKPAHAKLRGLYLIRRIDPDVWSDTDGSTWSHDNSVWGGEAAIAI